MLWHLKGTFAEEAVCQVCVGKEFAKHAKYTKGTIQDNTNAKVRYSMVCVINCVPFYIAQSRHQKMLSERVVKCKASYLFFQ